ncbi:MAG: glycosyltransferase family 4 protein [Lachnospiraceae bacterium]|nr:glycosyltransferase family 4 protein [Lachnospiraceae bacterium]
MKNKKKIVMIGPVYPYKGGISHYTGLMYRALAEEHDVTMISYKLQYPKLLYKKEQKDFSNDTFKIDNTNFLIHTANPFNWFHSAKEIKNLNPDLIIIQWWHPYFSPCYWTLCNFLKNYKKLFICHNVFPHERFPMDRFLTKRVLSNGDYFIVQSQQDEADLKSIKPNAVYQRTVHPTYNAFKIKDLSKVEGRQLLNIGESEQVLLFFGFVREYKGLKYLLHSLPQVTAKLNRIKLLVVGDFDGDKEVYTTLIHDLNMDSYIEIHDGYIPDLEVEKFFAASDLVVLPYESATQSGIVQIAYGFEKPVIVTDVGGLPEVVLDNQTGYVVEAKNSDALASAIIRFFEEQKSEDFKTAIQQEATRYSWSRMADTIYNLTEH